ncbi:hypothetical protein B0H12DRAFT_1096494 [Mycena haematopus]|nr:hypothetical protein B0H12DRAFT_1096494 [Mycena haematopus]
MALPMLVNNADCGPSNGLQGLSKYFDQDRGLQQDHFNSASRAGSSRETFRSQTSAPNANAAHLEDAARFFSGQPAGAPQLASGAFDLSALHGSLPRAQMQMQMQGAFQPAQASRPEVGWASDFMLRSQGSGVQKIRGSNGVELEREMNAAAASAGVSAAQQWTPGPMFSPLRPMQGYVPAMHMQQQQPQATQHDRTSVRPSVPRSCFACYDILTTNLFPSIPQRSYGTASSRPSSPPHPHHSSKRTRRLRSLTQDRWRKKRTSWRAPRGCCSRRCAPRRRRTRSSRRARFWG